MLTTESYEAKSYGATTRDTSDLFELLNRAHLRDARAV